LGKSRKKGGAVPKGKSQLLEMREDSSKRLSRRNPVKEHRGEGCWDVKEENSGHQEEYPPRPSRVTSDRFRGKGVQTLLVGSSVSGRRKKKERAPKDHSHTRGKKGIERVDITWSDRGRGGKECYSEKRNFRARIPRGGGKTTYWLRHIGRGQQFPRTILEG